MQNLILLPTRKINFGMGNRRVKISTFLKAVQRHCSGGRNVNRSGPVKFQSDKLNLPNGRARFLLWFNLKDCYRKIQLVLRIWGNYKIYSAEVSGSTSFNRVWAHESKRCLRGLRPWTNNLVRGWVMGFELGVCN